MSGARKVASDLFYIARVIAVPFAIWAALAVPFGHFHSDVSWAQAWKNTSGDMADLIDHFGGSDRSQ